MKKDGLLILVADNSAEVRAHLFALLDEEGYRVMALAKDRVALGFAVDESPELAILCLKTRDAQDIEYLDRFRHGAPATPLLLISSHPEWPTLFDVLEQDGEEWTSIPVRDRQLLLIVNHLMEGHPSPLP